MLVVRTIEDPADCVGELISAKQSLGLCNTLRLPWIHLGSIALSHGLLVGNRHPTIRTPWPLALTWRLWAAIQLRTSGLLCQLALSQINSRAFLPRALSLWQHHSTNRVVLWSSRVGRPRTLSKSVQVPAGTARSRRALWGRDRPFSALCGGDAPGGPPRPRAVQARPLKARKPTLILEAQNPLRMAPGEPDQPISIPFFGHIRDRGSLSSVWPASSAPQALPVSP
jgi:hypothetical protein